MMWTTQPRFNFPNGISGITAGEGEPVVLLHGVGLNADSWAAQIAALSKSWRVYALDLPGHGGSANLPRGQSDPQISVFSNRLAEVIESIEAPVHLMGHSLGALLAIDLAVRFPKLVKSLAGLNAVHRRSDAARAAVINRAESLSPESGSDPTPTLKRWFGNDLKSEPARACHEWLKVVRPEAYKVAYTAFAKAESAPDEALKGIACPTLFLTGREEPNSTPEMATALADLVPGASLKIIEGAAHMALMTHPYEVNACLLTFLEEAA